MSITRTDTPSPWTRWKGLLALSVGTSVGLNIWHAVATSGYGSAVLASIAPLFLFWITHNLVTDPAGVKGWRDDKVGVGVAAVVTLGAFAISYVTQRDLASLLGMTPFVAKILPLIVDLTIAVASYKLVRESEATDHSVLSGAPSAEPATHLGAAPVLRDVSADEPADEPATVTSPVRDADPAPVTTQTAPVRDVEPSEPAAHTATQESVLRDADTDEISLTSSASREAAPVRREVDAPKRRLAAVPATVRELDDEQAASRSSDPEVPATQTDPVREEPATQPAVVRDAERADDYLLRAQHLVDAGRTTAAIGEVVRVLRCKAAGMSNRDVAAEVGISEAKVQRIVKGDRELAGASA